MLPWIIVLGILGLLLVFAEMLIPGFGVFGVIGSLVLLGTSVLSYMTYGEMALILTVIILVAAFVLLIVIAKKSGLYEKFILHDKQEEQDFDESTLEGLCGAEGVTLTVLRPFGIAEFAGKRVDVCSKGEFINKGERVRVIEVKGKTVMVTVCEMNR